MKRNQLYVVMILLLVTLSAACALNKVTPKEVDEQAIEADVRRAIAGAVTDKTFDLSVQVNGTSVTIGGTVDNADQRSRIADAVRAVDGVTNVVNNIQIK